MANDLVFNVISDQPAPKPATRGASISPLRIAVEGVAKSGVGFVRVPASNGNLSRVRSRVGSTVSNVNARMGERRAKCYVAESRDAVIVAPA